MNHPTDSSKLSRRGFVIAGATGLALAALGERVATAQLSSDLRFKIIGFSKPFQMLKPAAVADTVEEIGWDGIECPVRPKGHIEPERAEDDLPALVAALKRSGKEIVIATTSIMKLGDPRTEKLLRLFAGLGIKRYRLGFQNYDFKRGIPDQLRELTAQLKDIAALNKELGLQAGIQNHSGSELFGAPLWDIWTVIKELEPKNMGICFDVGHATIEGGLSWPTSARLALPHLSAVFLKDFVWERKAQGWQPAWVPLGEGMVNPHFIKWLKSTSYNGPICQHHEYETGEGKLMITAMRRDLRVLRQWLAA